MTPYPRHTVTATVASGMDGEQGVLLSEVSRSLYFDFLLLIQFILPSVWHFKLGVVFTRQFLLCTDFLRAILGLPFPDMTQPLTRAVREV